MNTNEKLIVLRGYLDENIPKGGSEKDTRFTDIELTRLINTHESLYSAASMGWTLKASMIGRELGTIDEYSVGNERYKMTNLTTALNAALSMARQYKQMAEDEMNKGVSGFILKVNTPDVM